MNNEIQVPLISKEDSLPSGKIISFDGDDLALDANLRNDFLIWKLSDNSKEDKKLVWLLATKGNLGNVEYLSIRKKIKDLDYKLVKSCYIDYNTLQALYDRKRNIENQKEKGDDSLAIKQFETILTYAIAEKASDIHIEVQQKGAGIRMRIKGELVKYMADKRMSFEEASNLCSVIYMVLASSKDVAFDPRDCQQAAVPHTLGDQELKLRYQSVPAYPDGFDVILRVLPVGRSEEFTPLRDLGYTMQQEKQLLEITSRSVGALIIAGVTGSGKSTTLKNLLMYMNANTGYRRKIYSIEDPPEYNIPRITQIPVVIGKNSAASGVSPFEKPIKACMRGDPDVIMIGEVRDVTTGDLTKKAVQSGHQVLTTVHATSALGILPRLQDFGIKSSVLGSPDFLNGLLYQRLLKQVCPHCSINFNDLVQGKTKHNITQEHREMYSTISDLVNPLDYGIRIRNHDGCEKCKFTGIITLSVCAEVISLNMELVELISQEKFIELNKAWRKLSNLDPASDIMNGKTAMEHGFYKVLHGKACPFDLCDAFQPLHLMYPDERYKELKEKRRKLLVSEGNPLVNSKTQDIQDADI